jgi:rubrerythrin
MPRPIELMEFKCQECKAILLLEHHRNPEVCPYCIEMTLDYAPGVIEPVLEYTPRS